MTAGARPVFADIDPARMTIDPAAVEEQYKCRDERRYKKRPNCWAA